jgi:predicted transcriptional regulator
MSETTIERSGLLALTAEIVSAHVTNNSVGSGDVAALIQTVFETMNGLGSEEAAPAALTPAVPIKRSVTDDYIVCLEDGKKLKMLKRHLMTAYNMTPEEYRAKWRLKADYPMVAPNYALKRQELAKKIGLGRKPRVAEPAPAPAPAPKAVARKPRAKKAAA